MSLPRSLTAAVTLGCLLVGCRDTLVSNILTGVAQAVDTATGNGSGTLIRSKRTSSLSQDLTAVTLGVETAAPGGGAVTVSWKESTQFGTLGADRGANVQWAAKPGATGTAIIRVTAESGGKTDHTEIRLPVTNGRIKLAELTPEVTVAPQSAILYRPLPPSLGLSEDQLLGLGIRSKVTFGATTYRYNAQTNEKEKKPYDPDEIRWQSADPELVVISDSGSARPANGAKVGETAVVAFSKTDGNQRATALLKVNYLSTKINLTFDRTTVPAGATLALGATLTYANPDDRGRVIHTDAASKDVSWESSDKTKAQVDGAGTVRALEDAPAGSTVTITARSNYDPSVTEPITLTIRPRS
ncbi:MAG: Ig-like domain-containing protein [Candidatus Sericytochromatia bacterium]|nr:Ig-like domain-containing protein [Candidatus Sericytochromatia bacterium]